MHARMLADDSVRTMLAFTSDPQRRSELAEKLGRRYSETQTDSAIAYFTLAASEAERAGLKSKAARNEALVAGHVALRGDMEEAIRRFEAVDTAGMCNSDKAVYFGEALRVLYAVTNFYPDGLLRDGLLDDIRHNAADFVALMPDTLPVVHYVRGLLASMEGNMTLFEAELNWVTRSTDSSDPFNAMAHEGLAFHLLRNNLREEAIPHLITAACSELQNGVLTGAAPGLLARELLNIGDSQRGHALLQLSLDNARQANSKVRFAQASELTPMLAESLQRAVERRDLWIVVLCVVIVLLVALVLIDHVRQRRELKWARKVISYFNYSDEKRRNFFTGFLQLCALYIESLDDFTRTARRKMKAAQIEDLRKMIDSVDFFEAHADKFYKIFDTAFLQAFPHFVDDINLLLLPDKQVVPPEPESLTTELRVMAFMRIGFGDSSRIARFLGLSVNTIYTYRNRMRSRAISRDTFEDDLMQTGLSNCMLEE